MALIKIKNRREPLEIANQRAREIKKLRFGDINGHGKLDPFSDLDLGDQWAGTIGQVEWIELDKILIPPKFRFIEREKDGQIVATQVPLDYKLQNGEKFF